MNASTGASGRARGRRRAPAALAALLQKSVHPSAIRYGRRASGSASSAVQGPGKVRESLRLSDHGDDQPRVTVVLDQHSAAEQLQRGADWMPAIHQGARPAPRRMRCPVRACRRRSLRPTAHRHGRSTRWGSRVAPGGTAAFESENSNLAGSTSTSKGSSSTLRRANGPILPQVRGGRLGGNRTWAQERRRTGSPRTLIGLQKAKLGGGRRCQIFSGGSGHARRPDFTSATRVQLANLQRRLHAEATGNRHRGRSPRLAKLPEVGAARRFLMERRYAHGVRAGKWLRFALMARYNTG